MSVRPVEISGMLQRTDDVSLLKQQQDNKPFVQQHNLQEQVVKREDNLRHQVLTPADSAKTDTRADARDEGKNAYFFRKKAKKNKIEADEPITDRVIKKEGSAGFDMKV